MSFPRKRAPVACNYCRHRKRRCDGQTPTFSLCRDTGNVCEYPDVPTERPDNELTRRIDELTEIVLKQSEAINALTEDSRTRSARLSHSSGPASIAPPSAFAGSECRFDHSDRFSHSHTNGEYDEGRPSRSLQFMPEDPEDTDDTPLTIPVGHHTTTGCLFTLPTLRRILGEYPEDFLLRVESRRNLKFEGDHSQSFADELFYLNHHRESHQPWIDSFFTYIYPALPVLTPEIFQPTYNKVVEHGFNFDIETALCMMVLGLGKFATNLLTTDNLDQQDSQNGIEFFSAAYRIALVEWSACVGADVILPSTLMYGAIYLFYLGRPLQAWKIVTLASSSLQLIKNRPVSTHHGLSREQSAYIDRLVWGCYILESDCLAEFHLPRSGIEIVVDKMAFPHFESPPQRHCLLFLAHCSVRRLFNRIHSTLYSGSGTNLRSSSLQGYSEPDTPSRAYGNFTLESLATVCAELARQLDTWYMSLPDAIRPDLSSSVPFDVYDGWVRLRYWSAQHIIYRPCLLYASSFETEEKLPDHIISSSIACIQSCRNCIDTAHHLRMNHTQYTWMTTYGALACSLVLTVASMNGFLMNHVPDVNEILGKVAEIMERRTSGDTTAEFVITIIQIIRQRQRYQSLVPM